MRKKLREIMDKEEGFTLVELLAVIVILGIIMAIAVPSIGNVVNKAREDTAETEKVLIEDAARLYNTAEDEPTFPVSVETLIDKGYLDLRESKTEKTGEVTNTEGVFEFKPAE